MSLSTRIAPHLPYLRRFSRAVTGSQTSGDAYVAATLEALISDISLFPEASSDRIALYKLFSALFSSSAVSIPPGGDAVSAGPSTAGRSNARESGWTTQPSQAASSAPMSRRAIPGTGR